MIDPVADLSVTTRPALRRLEPVSHAHDDLTGRRVLVVGAQSDVGAAIVIATARSGAEVALSYPAAFHERGRSVASAVREIGPIAAEAVPSGPNVAPPGRADVTATMAATPGWTAGLATELIGRGIRVNAVAAGPAPIVPDEAVIDPASNRRLDALTRTAVLLASPDAAFASGETIRPGHVVSAW